MNYQDLTQSKKFRGIVTGFSIAVIVLLIFQIGVMFGYRKAHFSARLGDNYFRAFDSRPSGFPFGMMGSDLPGGHGAVGKIVSITLPTFILASSDNVEKIILVKNDTIIRHFRETLATSNLALNDSVVVLGTPNDQGEIEAQLIRIIK
ncbi:MAG: hypothetical protein V1704_02280 [Candidatus Vogelbacteria bacterium]